MQTAPGLSRNARERDNYQYKKGEPSHRHELTVFVQPESIGKAPEGYQVIERDPLQSYKNW